jgi:hypothetical protein
VGFIWRIGLRTLQVGFTFTLAPQGSVGFDEHTGLRNNAMGLMLILAFALSSWGFKSTIGWRITQVS